MPQAIDLQLKNLLLSTEFRPAITLWNRLEGRARKEEFDRSLRVEVRDPLWMLTRQWQVGEFKGEDAGSAAKARVQVATGRINQFVVRSAVPVAYDTSMPLDVQVEREPIWEDGTSSERDYLALRGQAGRHWMRMLRRAGFATLKNAFVQRFGFEDTGEGPSSTEADKLEIAQIESNSATWQELRLFAGRLPDGRRLLKAIADGKFNAWVEAEFDTTTQSALKDLAVDFRAWFERLYSQPAREQEDAWAPSYLEYQFAASAPADASNSTSTTLVAEQYHQGHLDWYAFDVDPRRRLEGEAPATGFDEGTPLALIPTQIEYSGMPNVRWWEMEDRRTDFGSIRAATTDMPLLVLAECALIYANDWTVIPYNLPVGTVADIRGLIVTDVFGVRTLVRAAGEAQGTNWQRWSMYRLTARSGRTSTDRRLLLAPAVAKIQKGEPIETVIFARDEMTNMVWAVEERIPGMLGTGVNGFEAATALSRYFTQHAPESSPGGEPGEANIRYVLGTSVPENWIPFVPRHRPDSERLIRLQRASMPRLTDALPLSRIEPRGRILRTGLDVKPPDVREPYFLNQGEVPRAGAIVTRCFQRARWFDGKVYTWVGRRKQTGRGQGASGLEFDRVTLSG